MPYCTRHWTLFPENLVFVMIWTIRGVTVTLLKSGLTLEHPANHTISLLDIGPLFGDETPKIHISGVMGEDEGNLSNLDGSCHQATDLQSRLLVELRPGDLRFVSIIPFLKTEKINI